MNENNPRLTEPGTPPTTAQLESWLGKKALGFWRQVEGMIAERYPGVFVPEWLYGGKKHGWSNHSDNLLQRAEQRRQTTEAILRDLDLMNRWRRFGRPVLVGTLAIDEAGIDWKVDMWSAPEDYALPRGEHFVELMKTALTPETRMAILALKESRASGKLPTFLSVDLYRAVIEGGVRTPDQWRGWQQTHDTGVLTDWRPAIG